MNFLNLSDKWVVIFGVSNRKSVGYAVGTALSEAGAKPIYVVHTEARKASLERWVKDAPIYVCDVEKEGDILKVAAKIQEGAPQVHGIVHSIAFANYTDGMKPFHETKREDFLQALQISCHSLTEIAHAFTECLAPNGSVVTISISTTSMAAENYGYMAPVKAALDSSVVFLAKSFSAFSRVRFNAVCAGLLKTSSSAGIPGYVDSYLFAEKATLRNQGVKTEEVADTVAFLLSPRAQGINAQRVVVDAGMACNYFDSAIVKRAV